MKNFKRERIGPIVAALFWGLLWLCLEVKPSDAMSNASAWLKIVGIPHVPAWLNAPSADISLKCVVVFCFLANMAWIFGPAIKRRIALHGVITPLVAEPRHPPLEKQTTPPQSTTVINAPPGPNADWHISELFSYLSPDLIDRDDKERSALELKIKDALSLGQLRAWGRNMSGFDWTKIPVSEISKAYWQKARFTYSFLKSDYRRPDSCDTFGAPDYADIQISSAEAKAIWSKEKHEVKTFAERWADKQFMQMGSFSEPWEKPQEYSKLFRLPTDKTVTLLFAPDSNKREDCLLLVLFAYKKFFQIDRVPHSDATSGMNSARLTALYEFVGMLGSGPTGAVDIARDRLYREVRRVDLAKGVKLELTTEGYTRAYHMAVDLISRA